MSELESQKEALLWLRYAKEDLAAAEGLIGHILTPRHVCFLSKQSAEKAIKAMLVFSQIDFPRTHDLEALLQIVPKGWRIKECPPDLTPLSEWAVEARYPGDWPEATTEEAHRALDLARGVYELIAEDLRTRRLVEK
jgi:HEPN domain-containing protein